MGCISGPGVWRNDVFLALLKLTLVLIRITVNGTARRMAMPCFRADRIRFGTCGGENSWFLNAKLSFKMNCGRLDFQKEFVRSIGL